jgi:hypothetical protein
VVSVFSSFNGSIEGIVQRLKMYKDPTLAYEIKVGELMDYDYFLLCAGWDMNGLATIIMSFNQLKKNKFCNVVYSGACVVALLQPIKPFPFC